MPERYTQAEVSRIVGVEPGRLRYWQRLRLVRPRARWGARFYSFSDLVALRSIKRLAEQRIPVRRLCRAVASLERRLGEENFRLGELRMVAKGREVVLIPPSPANYAIEPLTGQLLLPFDRVASAAKVRQMESRSAEEWLEYAAGCDAQPGMAEEAMRAYRRVVALRPDWFEPQINLGCLLYQAGQLEETRQTFGKALELAPESAIVHFNLGCALDELGILDEAIEHLRRATELAPDHADAHFNLAAACEKRGEKRLALEHWLAYLRCQPQGPWADYARLRAEKVRTGQPSPAPIPIRPES